MNAYFGRRSLTWDEALLWLNDRLGENVHVAVEIMGVDPALPTVSPTGELRRWLSGLYAWATASSSI